jgi:hypothetical protein
MRIGLLRNESLCEGIAVSACSLQTANLQSVPPVAGWQPLKIKFREAFPAGVRVFDSGFRARQIEPQTWQYWGAPGGQHNITVVHGQRIVLRARIKDTVGSTTLYPSVLESRVLTPKSNRKRNNF